LSPASFREELAVRGLADRAAFASRLALRGWVDFNSDKWLVSLARLMLAFNENTYYSFILGPKGRMGWKVDVAISLFLGPGSPLYGRPGFQENTYIGFLLHWLGVGDALSKGRIQRWSCHFPTDLDFVMKFSKLYMNCLKSFQRRMDTIRRTLLESAEQFESKLLLDYTNDQKWSDPTQIVIFLDWLEDFKTRITEYTGGVSRLRARYTTCTGTMVLGAAHDIPAHHRDLVSQLRRRLSEWVCTHGNRYAERVSEIIMRLVQQQLVLTHLLPLPKVSDFDPNLPPRQEILSRGPREWISLAMEAGFLTPLSEESGRLSLRGVHALKAIQRRAESQLISDKYTDDFMSGRGLRLARTSNHANMKENTLNRGGPARIPRALG